MAGHGFVHGDIKPANIITDEGGQISMIDTGSMAKISKRTATKPDALRLDSDYFDKGTRPTTPGYTHPGYSASPNRVGLEQDLFGMGVTLLQTKLTGIAADLVSQGRADDAVDFLDTANTILDEIKEADDANDLKAEIQSRLRDLERMYPGTLADRELNWATMCIGKALDQTKPAIDRPAWQAELAQLRKQLPGV
jgi:serine/threonine protein kinase